MKALFRVTYLKVNIETESQVYFLIIYIRYSPRIEKIVGEVNAVLFINYFYFYSPDNFNF